MRNALALILITAVTLVFNGGFSQPSKYEGKIVRKIEFVGLKKLIAVIKK